jgi:hypothetical protein
MVLEAGIRRERNYVEWCDNFLKLAKRFPPHEGRQETEETVNVY